MLEITRLWPSTRAKDCTWIVRDIHCYCRRRVYDIVSLLPLGGLDELRRNWAGTGASGATKENFLENMLRVRGETKGV